MSTAFTKMHANSNDFMLLDTLRQKVSLTPRLIRHWSDRHTGIGFDQLLLVTWRRHLDSDFFCQIFNADGNEVAQCGNGVCCLAKFLHSEGLAHKNRLRIETVAANLKLTLGQHDEVTADLGRPILVPDQIPFLAEAQADSYRFELDLPLLPEDSITVSVLSLGNPHCTLLVSNIDEAPVQCLGQCLSQHPRFPQGSNVEFMQVLSPQRIRLRVYERGVGETKACGSGACAAVVAGRLLGLLATEVKVDLPGGPVQVVWDHPRASVRLTTRVTRVFRGLLD